MAAIFHFLVIFMFCLTGFCWQLEGTQNTKIKAVAFDFGGVIVKTDRHQVADFIAKSLDIPPEEALKTLGGIKETTLKDSSESDFWISYVKARGKKLPDDWMEKLSNVRLHALKEIPGMVDLVKGLKKQGIQIALLSNVRESQAQIKRKLGLYDLFHPVLLSYEVGIRKPDPKAYKLLLDKLNLPPEAVIFVDNKPDNIEAAKAMGIDGILFENAPKLIQALKERGIIINLQDPVSPGILHEKG